MEMRNIEQHPNNCPRKMFYINYMEIEHIILGKTSKNKMLAKRKREYAKLEHNWKKKSIFFSNFHIGKPLFCVTI